MTNSQKWDYALGLIQIDGLTPSEEFLELVEKEKRGEITTADMKKALDSKYKMQGDNLCHASIPGDRQRYRHERQATNW
jgi:hypothetical protein